MPRDAASQHAAAWLLLAGTLALHVLDEALTGFLDFYNPLVLRIRPVGSPFPPTFDFGPWLTGLIVLIVVLVLLTPAVRRGAAGTRAASWIFTVLMFLNGVGHLAGSASFERWLPGATTAPLVIVASVYLGRCTNGRR
jgi:hypothetical protein